MGTKFRAINKKSYLPVAIDKLIVGTRLPCDIHLKEGSITRPLFDAGSDFTKITQEFLIDRGIHEIYISEDDKDLLDTYAAKAYDDGSSILDSAKAFKDYSFRKDTYYQIDKKMLVPGSLVPFSIYSISNYLYVPILHATEKKPEVIGGKITSAARDLLISRDDLPLYNEYLHSVLTSGGFSGSELERMRAFVVKENSKLIVKDLLDNPRSGEKIKEAHESVNTMIETIMSDRDAIYDLLSLRGFDYYTYTHSVNVGVLAIGLGVAIDLKRDDIEKLGMGAILHDIGKSAIPSEILNKQGKLDDREFMIIQSHVPEGGKLLKENHRLPDESIFAVLQHHEKLNGRGYPLRLSEKEITLHGRITAIADCYDALTTSRPYKPAFTPFYALATIAKETGNYDPELLRIFIKMLGKV